jgi:hypothetical protein
MKKQELAIGNWHLVKSMARISWIALIANC